MRKEPREFLIWAKRLGCEYGGYDGRDHHVLVTPDGQRIPFPASPSDRRWMKNAKAEVRRLIGAREDRPRSGRYSHKASTLRFKPKRSARDKAIAAGADRLERELREIDRALRSAQRTDDMRAAVDLCLQRAEVEDQIRALYRPVPPHPFGDVRSLVEDVREEQVVQPE